MDPVVATAIVSQITAQTRNVKTKNNQMGTNVLETLHVNQTFVTKAPVEKVKKRTDFNVNLTLNVYLSGVTKGTATSLVGTMFKMDTIVTKMDHVFQTIAQMEDANPRTIIFLLIALVHQTTNVHPITVEILGVRQTVNLSCKMARPV
eukprot:CAMPEP_0178963200 /NCGR_PEP_ID=MMETSP0789-20121207/14872_1 /TAXON_ID=3005 /ORGANISM="Rhizosolenia setigera, Strain CCMP 1694" /LENGTH=147 /DNA_ID=CAMNT_0020647603 /DNA_START=507 /DNA_END=950 /DNA_ORIENTATION=+